jgi:hypothetical protein
MIELQALLTVLGAPGRVRERIVACRLEPLGQAPVLAAAAGVTLGWAAHRMMLARAR